MRVYVATKNAGKLREMEKIFAGSPFDLATYDAYADPVEGDASYLDNAALKARTLHAQLRRDGESGCVLADDSGVEVLALGGRPGVLTAYYGGTEATWPERRTKLIAELDASGSADRRARFVCAMYFIDADGREFGALGTVDGLIPAHERGSDGFSFDPVFYYPPAGKTFAELSEDEKNRVSHRAIAAAGLVAAVRASGARMRP